jgi:hypothetical protein
MSTRHQVLLLCELLRRLNPLTEELCQVVELIKTIIDHDSTDVDNSIIGDNSYVDSTTVVDQILLKAIENLQNR